MDSLTENRQIRKLDVSDMTKVITYGTYDLLHYGHIRLLKGQKNSEII